MTMLVAGVAVVILVLIGAGVFYWTGTGEAPSTELVYEVSTGEFSHDVVEKGEVESSSNVEIRCEVKSRNGSGIAVLEVIPEGSNVKAGDVLAKLDSSALELERTQQQIACNTSESVMIQARNTYEAALISRQEYLEGTFRQEEQLKESEVFVAEENLRRAQLALQSSERLAANGFVTQLQLEADQFAVEKAQKELESARTRLKVLRDYTKAKMLKQFDSDIKSAEAKWKAEESSYQLELAKLKDIDEQVKKCTIVAPSAGQVKYANTTNNRGGGTDFIVEQGVLIRERQALIRLPDPKLMQVRAKINESRVARIRVGQKAHVSLVGYGDKELEGEVIRVNEYPEPTSFFSSSVKEYATLIRIINPLPGIRPGLSASVKIHVEQLSNVVQVPVQSVIEKAGRSFVFLQRGKDWEPREVSLGSTNDSFVVIKQGVAVHDVVSMTPRRFVEKIEVPDAPAPTKEAIVAKPGESKPNDSKPGDAPPSGGEKKPEATPTAIAGNGESGEGAPKKKSGGPGGEGKRGGGDPVAIAASMMTRMDTNGDGKLSAEEIPEDRRERFLSGDKNGDGQIDLSELQANMARARASSGGGGGGFRGPGGPGGGPPGAPSGGGE